MIPLLLIYLRFTSYLVIAVGLIMLATAREVRGWSANKAFILCLSFYFLSVAASVFVRGADGLALYFDLVDYLVTPASVVSAITIWLALIERSKRR